MQNPSDLTLWFVKSTEELNDIIQRMCNQVGKRGLWIAWPKKASRIESDLTQQIVRNTGLNAGLVDYKVCSIDSTWSGLLFTHRKKVQKDL